jgi:glucosamine-6-phosphate deaminase
VKADAAEKTLRSKDVTNLVSATLLKTHPDFLLYLDRDSAARIFSV